MEMKKLSVIDITEIKDLFYDIFANEPWNDDWSNQEQLHAYIMDLIGNNNSLAFGLYDHDILVGIALGSVIHWYAGTEYYINEFGIRREVQGQGMGTKFLELIEDNIRKSGMKSIFLQTERTVAAYEFYKKREFCELKDHVSFWKRLESNVR